MDHNEKRYFKLQAGATKGDSALLRLFDAISHQKEPDDRQLQKRLRKHVTVRYLPVLKTRLHATILKVLRNYHGSGTVENQLRGWLQDIQYLYEKRLYDQCGKLIQKARKLAGQEDQFLLLTAILEWEEKLQTHQRPGPQKLENIEALYREKRTVATKYLNLSQYRQLERRLRFQLQESYMRLSANQQDICHSFIAHPLLVNESAALCAEALIIYCDLHTLLSAIRKDWIKAYYYRSRAIDLIRVYGRESVWKTEKYLRAVFSIIPVALELGHVKEAGRYLDKINHIEEVFPNVRKTKDLELKTDLWHSDAALVCCRFTGGFNQGALIIERLGDLLQKPRKKLSTQAVLRLSYNAAYFYFAFGRYEEALAWLQDIFNHSGFKNNERLNYASRLLNLVTHLELGNDKMIEHLARSTQRYLEHIEALPGPRRVKLRFIRRLSQTPEDQRLPLYREFQEALAEAGHAPDAEMSRLSYFDIQAWLCSKLQQQPYYKCLASEKVEEAEIS